MTGDIKVKDIREVIKDLDNDVRVMVLSREGNWKDTIKYDDVRKCVVITRYK